MNTTGIAIWWVAILVVCVLGVIAQTSFIDRVSSSMETTKQLEQQYTELKAQQTEILQRLSLIEGRLLERKMKD